MPDITDADIQQLFKEYPLAREATRRIVAEREAAELRAQLEAKTGGTGDAEARAEGKPAQAEAKAKVKPS